MKVGRIIDHIADFGVVHLLLRSLFKPVELDSGESTGAVTGKPAESSNRVTFGDPEPEPTPATVGAVIGLFPDECPLTS